MNIELAILNVLAASPRAIPVSVIVPFCAQFLGEQPTHADVHRALNRLEAKGHVKGTANEDTGTKWKETDDGRLRIE